MKMNKYYYIFALALSLLMACENKNKFSTEEEKEKKETQTAEMSDVILTQSQFEQLHIKTGKIGAYLFTGKVVANGKIASSPQSEAAVTSYIGANIQRIMVREGQEIRRGQVLAYLSHPDILDLQSRYLTAYHQLSYVSQEFNRQKTLLSNKVGSGHDFQKIESEYRVLQAEIRTTAAQMQMLGINPSMVRQGKTMTMIPVVSPINGTVERIYMETGQYADPQQTMMHIVNTDHLFADLLVYEKDIHLVKVGQRIVIEPSSMAGRTLHGKVFSIGKTFADDAKAIHVRANMEGDHKGLITGMYLRGVITTEDVKRMAISTDGIIDEDGKSYIFEAQHKNNQWIFHPVEVKKGIEEDGMVQILNPSTKEVALNQAYYLISEMKKAETGED